MVRFEDYLDKEELKDWEEFNENVIPIMIQKGLRVDFAPYEFANFYRRHKKEFMDELNGLPSKDVVVS